MKRILAMLLALTALFTAIMPLSGCGEGSEKEAVGTYPVSVAGVTIEKHAAALETMRSCQITVL